MLLSYAIQKNSKSFAYIHNEYKQNVVTVNNFITSVLNSKLPAFNDPPPNYEDFQNTFIQSKSIALDWINNVMLGLKSYPTNITNDNDVISNCLNDAKDMANNLINSPNDNMARNMFLMSLNNLSVTLNSITLFITSSLKNIQNFKNVMPNMASNLQAFADSSLKESGADQELIDQLKKDIDNLNDQIKSLTADIVALGIADGAALILGALSLVAGPIGAVTWLFLGPAIAAASYYIAIDTIEIKTAQETINNDNAKITGITADVAVLQLLSKNYTSMANEVTSLEANVQLILNEWQSLEKDINIATGDISTAITNTKSANFNAVLNDITDAIKEWNVVYSQAGSLSLNLKGSDAKLKIGMSSDDVKVAIEQSKTIDIIEYFNQIAI